MSKIKDMSIQESDNHDNSRKPKCTVPFSLDPDFVERPEIWTQITDLYAGSSDRVALVGMGGFGYGSLFLLKRATLTPSQ